MYYERLIVQHQQELARKILERLPEEQRQALDASLREDIRQGLAGYAKDLGTILRQRYPLVFGNGRGS